MQCLLRRDVPHHRRGEAGMLLLTLRDIYEVFSGGPARKDARHRPSLAERLGLAGRKQGRGPPPSKMKRA